MEHSNFSLSFLPLDAKKIITMALRGSLWRVQTTWIRDDADGTPKAPLKRFGEAVDSLDYVLSAEEESMMDAFSNSLIDMILTNPKKYLLPNGTPK